ncbi:PREDICTED: tetraspanin-19-like [Nelumbo nucifera]|uniref:Tetraspanin-19-like n=2 Tax=Nelumbo nucifera TaxID=4432 RepID=A0A822YS98_NELNU|nr:PREDICTED: tetraspanin-19-like [Nelumbo nucifera]DAD35532.1 TPA_asm: hypothetical protein HUJ06_006172 [Nelumbo nucifera]
MRELSSRATPRRRFELRCFLHYTMRTVNLVINFCGIAMIIYSLWLLKRWGQGESQLNPALPPTTPWFIYTCLALGIVICFSMLCGHVVASYSSNFTLFIYIVSVFFILCLQIGAIVEIFFEMNVLAKISKYVVDQDMRFINFLTVHMTICRIIGVVVLVAQITAFILAIILWAMGSEPRSHCIVLDSNELRYSFLLGPGPLENLNRSRMNRRWLYCNER